MARLDHETSLKYQTAIQYTVGKILEAISNESSDNVAGCCSSNAISFSKEVILAAGLLVFKKIPILALDLEAFAKHAKRQKIITDDVLLCARRNPSLLARLEILSKHMKADKQEKLKVSPATALNQPNRSVPPLQAEEVEIIDLDALT